MNPQSADGEERLSLGSVVLDIALNGLHWCRLALVRVGALRSGGTRCRQDQGGCSHNRRAYCPHC
jgi:hypothetical protein